MSQFEHLARRPATPVHVGDIVEADGGGPLMFVEELRPGAARCAWVHLFGFGEGVFPLATLRRAPAPPACPAA